MLKYKSKIFLLLFTLILLPVFSLYAETSENNQIPQNDANSGGDAPDNILLAYSVNLNTKYSGKIGDNLTSTTALFSDEDNYDYYKIDLTATGNFSLSYKTTNELVSSFTTVTIMKNGNTISTESFWEDDLIFYLVAPISHDDTYEIEIRSFSDLVEYDFELHYTTGAIPIQNDAGTLGDASEIAPKSVNLDVTYFGEIGNGAIDSEGYLDDVDYYTVSLSGQGYLTVLAYIFTFDSLEDLTIRVNTPGGEEILGESQSIFASSLLEEAPIAEAGVYQVEFDSDNWNASYSFSLSFSLETIPSQTDSLASGDASENYEDSLIVGINTTISGSVGEGLLEVYDNARDDDDLYRLGTVNYGKLIINLTLDFHVESYASVFSKIKNESDLFEFSILSLSASSFSPYEDDSIILYPGSNYYLEISTYSKAVEYSINITYIELPYSPPSTTSSSSETQITSSSDTPTQSSQKSSASASQDSNPTTSSIGISTSVMAFGIFLILNRRKKK